MPDEYVDVYLEVPTNWLARLDDPTWAIYEAMRDKANEKCAEVGRRVDAGLGPVETRLVDAQAADRTDMTLVASRWRVAQ